MRRLLATTGLGLALLAPASAGAANTRGLWATVNTCDSAKGVIGLRASMPGNATDQRMYMRFAVQWRKADFTWADSGASSRWIRVGTARRRTVQSGYDFAFAPPASGAAYKLRGKVDFRWTAKRKKGGRVVVRRATRTTSGGIRGVEGGSPKGRSDAACLLQR